MLRCAININSPFSFLYNYLNLELIYSKGLKVLLMKMQGNNKHIEQMISSNSKTNFSYSEGMNYNFRYFSNGVSDIHHPIIAAEILD